MSKYKIGVSAIKIGAIAGDGGMGTSLSAGGDTVAGSASLVTEEGTKTDFNIEEADDPVYSILSEKGKITLAWSTYANDANSLEKFFGGTKTPAAVNGINVLGAITAGSSYTNGIYYDVPLTGGTGTGAKANIVVSGGAVTAVAITERGSGYAAAASLSALAANIGGTGSGFAVVVTSVADIGEKWAAPDSLPELEKSVEITLKTGGKVEIVRAKLISKINWPLDKTKMAQIDITSSILKPTKTSASPMTITDGA
jgi:hypothetical protein